MSDDQLQLCPPVLDKAYLVAGEKQHALNAGSKRLQILSILVEALH
jgi:hypothetical protein